MTYSIDRHRRAPPPWRFRWPPACCSPRAAAPAAPAATAARSRRPSRSPTAPANAKDNSYEVLAKDYEAAHPGVTIKLNRINAEAYGQTLQTQMAAGNGPDVMQVNSGGGQPGTVGQLAKAGPAPAADRLELHHRHPRGRARGLRLQRQALRRAERDGGRRRHLQRRAGQVERRERSTRPPGSTTSSRSAARPRGEGQVDLRPRRARSRRTPASWPSRSPPRPCTARTRTGTRSGPTNKTTFAGTKGWHQALQAVIDMNKAGCFQDGAAGAGFDALTNGASPGKVLGFFAPSGAAKSIMDAAGGHVKLVALGIPRPGRRRTTCRSAPTSGWPATRRPRAPSSSTDFLKFSVSPGRGQEVRRRAGHDPDRRRHQRRRPAAAVPAGGRPADEQAVPRLRRRQTGRTPKVYNALGTGVTGLLTGQKTIDDVLKDDGRRLGQLIRSTVGGAVTPPHPPAGRRPGPRPTPPTAREIRGQA